MDVDKVAHLARIQITPSEAQDFAAQFPKILDHFAKLEKLDTTGVEPLVTASIMENILRKDINQEWLECKKALEQGPVMQGNLYKVPPVV